MDLQDAAGNGPLPKRSRVVPEPPSMHTSAPATAKTKFFEHLSEELAGGGSSRDAFLADQRLERQMAKKLGLRSVSFGSCINSCRATWPLC